MQRKSTFSEMKNSEGSGGFGKGKFSIEGFFGFLLRIAELIWYFMGTLARTKFETSLFKVC